MQKRATSYPSPKQRRSLLSKVEGRRHKTPTRLQNWMKANEILPADILRFTPGMSRQWFTKLRWTTSGEVDTTLGTMKKVLRAARLALALENGGSRRAVSRVEMADLFDLEPDQPAQ